MHLLDKYVPSPWLVDHQFARDVDLSLPLMPLLSQLFISIFNFNLDEMFLFPPTKNETPKADSKMLALTWVGKVRKVFLLLIKTLTRDDVLARLFPYFPK